MTEQEPVPPHTPAAAAVVDESPLRTPQQRSRTFTAILVNTGLANITTSYLWFALTFWVYLETRNVIATGVVGGAYMLLIALSSISFGTYVDRYRKLAPYARSSEGAAQLAPLLGEGTSRGIALVFLVAGIILIAAALLAFLTPVYRRVSGSYAQTDAGAVTTPTTGA